MIAVFCYNKTQFEVDCRPHPRKNFKIIKDKDDLRGKKFIGLIVLQDAFIQDFSY
jgi:hypothetical protein